MNGWFIGSCIGTLITTGCTIANSVSSMKKQEKKFNDMCNNLTTQFCEKYDLEESIDEGTESL